jgi:hypothetical protein
VVAIIVSAIVTAAGALMIGQAVLRACGARRWSWLSAPVGFAVEVVVAISAGNAPGRTTTTAVVLGALVVASAVWVLRDPPMRPPLAGLLAALPTGLLAMVPFAASGRAGLLGVSFDNDMALHLLLAGHYQSPTMFPLTSFQADYPLGPHALAATLAQGLGAGLDATFTGLSAALPVLIAWTALGALRRAGVLGQVAVATLVGMTFLVASYYGEGSFKEPAQALLVLGVAVALLERDLIGGRGRWVPVAVICAGCVTVYSVLGLAWPVGILGAAFAVLVLRTLVGESSRQALRAEIGPAVIAASIFLVALAVQLPRLVRFVSRTWDVNGTGIPVSGLGNLAGPVSFWEVFGVWDSIDFRFPAVDAFAVGAWTAFVAALVAAGVVLALRGREWALVLAAGVSLAIWFVSERTQSPYVSAKALVILAPLVILLAARPLLDAQGVLGPSVPRWWSLLAPLLALALIVQTLGASLQALRFMPVGPTDHARELATLKRTIGNRPVLFLGNSDFIQWELAGVQLKAPLIGIQVLPLRAEKPWKYGDAIDIDSIEPAELNLADYVITSRDPAASAMPSQLRRVGQTASFSLWRRTATVPARRVLAEGGAAGAPLDCETKAGRAIVRGGGVAAVIPRTVSVAVAGLAPGTSIGVRMKLAPGEYDISTPYTSPRPISITVGSLTKILPANLDRPGPRFEVGRIAVARGTPFVQVGLYATKTRLTSPRSSVPPTTILATPASGHRTVAIGEACGKLVDWYQPGPPRA